MDYFKDFDSLSSHDGQICIILRNGFAESGKQKIVRTLTDEYSDIIFSEDTASFDSYFTNPEILVVNYRVDLNLFHATVHEGNGSFGYMEVWESDYYWLLTKWILIERTNVAQS